MICNRRGQGAIEFLLVTLLVSFMVSFCFIITFLGFSKSYIQHQGYQALICKNTEGFNNCREQLEKSVSILPFGKINKIKLNTKKVYISWEVQIYQRLIRLKTSQRFSIKEWI